LSVPAQSALFDQLSPGIVGGLVLTLLQLALLPLVAVWALTVLLGGTVGVGTSTGISLDGAETGVLPVLPMLGALPGPADFPSAVWLLMILPMLPVGLGAVRLVRDVAHLERRERIIAWSAYPAAVVVVGLLLAGLSTGGIGDGRLVHLGPQMSTLALPLIGIVVVSTGLVLAVSATPLIPWSRRTLGSVRARVEAADRDGRRRRGRHGHRARRGGRTQRPPGTVRTPEPAHDGHIPRTEQRDRGLRGRRSLGIRRQRPRARRARGRRPRTRPVDGGAAGVAGRRRDRRGGRGGHPRRPRREEDLAHPPPRPLSQFTIESCTAASHSIRACSVRADERHCSSSDIGP